MTRPANIFALDIKMTIEKMSFLINAFDEIYKLNTRLVGDYNVYNIMSAIGVCRMIGISQKNIENTINNIANIDGRWEIFSLDNNQLKNIKIVVDFAHTSDGFDKILSLIKSLRKGRIITLFGCVGYSDKEKRKSMGDIASKYSDYIIFTSDNICNSSFMDIVNDVDIKIPHKDIEDREKAVEYAFGILEDNDTLILLGKGNEKVQKVKDTSIAYDEIKIVKNLLKQYKK